jgi:hypothetical protein
MYVLNDCTFWADHISLYQLELFYLLHYNHKLLLYVLLQWLILYCVCCYLLTNSTSTLVDRWNTNYITMISPQKSEKWKWSCGKQHIYFLKYCKKNKRVHVYMKYYSLYNKVFFMQKCLFLPGHISGWGEVVHEIFPQKESISGDCT